MLHSLNHRLKALKLTRKINSFQKNLDQKTSNLIDFKNEFQSEISKHYENRTRGDRTFSVLKILSKYKEIKSKFEENGEPLKMDISHYQRLLDITYTPSGIPLNEKVSLFEDLLNDVKAISESDQNLPILTALKILSCANETEAVNISMSIAREVPSCDGLILSALLYVRFIHHGSLKTKIWMEKIIEEPWFCNESGPQYFRWSLRVCNSLVYYLSKESHFKEAREVIDSMAKYQIHPTVATWNFLLTFYARKGYSNEVKRIFEEMKEYCTPNRLSYESVIESILTPYARSALSTKSGSSK
jgi:pentatricopeptide repeat protein